MSLFLKGKHRLAAALCAACAAACVVAAAPAPALAVGPVVLDAGHGGTDGGAGGHGLKESDLTWKIANYAKERLDQLGIPTVLSRASQNANPSLYQRNKVAVDTDARAIVSFHINSGGGTGAEVLVANNAAYNNFCATETQAFGRDVLARLSAPAPGPGLKNRGNKLRDFPAGSTASLYASAQPADYYAIVRNARASGFSGTIIEHGFIDTAADALKLKNEAFLKQLGYADAEAIARQWPNTYTKPQASSYGTRWIKEGDRWRWFEVSGAYGSYKTSGWVDTGGKTYLISGGYMVTGWAKVGGRWYYLNAPNGDMATGWKQVGGAWYWLRPAAGSGPEGSMGTGWLNDGGTWYFLDRSSGAMKTGWQDIDGKRYHFSGSGAMATGTQAIDGRTYVFDGSGALVRELRDGWSKEGGTWYLYGAGKRLTGWQTVAGHRYYLDPSSGAMRTGWVTVDGKTYWLRPAGSGSGPEGSMGCGWLPFGGRWYYLDRASGAMKTGWLDVGGSRYWLRPAGSGSGPEGSMGCGWLNDGGTWYFLDRASGAMKTGWQDIDGKRYHFSGSGAMATGTQAIDGRTYEFDGSGAFIREVALKSGWSKEGGTWYLYGAGKRLTGWQTVEGHRYYLDPSSGAMRTGWVTVDGKTYWLRPAGSGSGPEGSMGCGWLSSGGKWYFLDRSTGARATGWLTVDGARYYFAPNSGAMATGTQTIDGTTYLFADSGALRGEGEPIMGSPKVSQAAFVDKMAALIEGTYPAIYRSDARYGATTPRAFAEAVWKAATAEGVRPEVLGAQVCLETGNLKFGGIVNADQCNFGGLGALDGNANGDAATFKDIPTGLLAQAQHLKAYGSTEPLKTACVDPRFSLVKPRGKAPTVLGLSGTWASDKEYGAKLTQIMGRFGA